MTKNNREQIQVVPTQVREIRPTRRSVSGYHPFKGEASVPYESALERDFLIKCDFDDHVLQVIPQPVEIPFTMPLGRKYIYTPDFLVYRSLSTQPYPNYLRPLLIEVKPYDEWKKNWRKWSAKWKAARRFAIEQGWEFRILDESRIRDVTLENLMFLSRYKRLEFSDEESLAIVESVSERGTVEFHSLLARHFMGAFQAVGISHIWYLVAVKKLRCDLSKPIGNFTELWVANTNE